MRNLGKRLFDRRKSDQFITTDGVEVKILFSSENPSLLGKTVSTTAIEISPRGLRLEVGYPIEIDSVLDVVVKVAGSNREYYLTGNVRWRLPSTLGLYHVVLVLRERTDIRSDLRAWKANFDHNFDFSDVG
ncbi:MAG: PilZ domain-containing protein [Gammaproteobacteria bacterium]|nr:PilZ domain-containing protein [Gammaproteobacteria bacterium]